MFIKAASATHSLEELVDTESLVSIVAIDVSVLEGGLLVLVFDIILHKLPVLKSELADLIVVENDSDCENVFQIEKNMRMLAQIFLVTLKEVMVVLHYAALQV